MACAGRIEGWRLEKLVKKNLKARNNLIYSSMTKPKHLSDESWEIISRPENKFQQFLFGLGEVGETVESRGAVFKFVGNFARKKDADAIKSETRKVHPYLYGKLKTGWAVIERI